MPEIPHSALSDALSEQLRNRRVTCAVFLTYQLDPAFFELEILPVLFDANFSHIPKVRLVQMNDALRQMQVTVFYDAGGLLTEETGSPKLDVRRVPVRWPRGIFHPKNLLLLVEEDLEDGQRVRSLVVAAMSANLTKNGWWENIEVCHFEELADGEATNLRDPLLALLAELRKHTASPEATASVEEIRGFLANRTSQRAQRSKDGSVHPHFFCSASQSLPDFLEAVAGPQLKGASLEVISPFFDGTQDVRPLQELIERFEPSEVRICLPTTRAGNIGLQEAQYDAVAELERVHWARLPSSLTTPRKKSERFTHAKVYRFFSGATEYLLVGSPNLTGSAHGRNQNLETGLFVEVRAARKQDFWLERSRPSNPVFEPVQGEGEGSTSVASRLQLRFNWKAMEAEAYWTDDEASPPLQLLTVLNVPLIQLPGLAPAAWAPLAPGAAADLAKALEHSAFLKVRGEQETDVMILVQEEGMTHRPPLVANLTVAEILDFWARANEDQRRMLLEQRILERFPEVANDLVARSAKLRAGNSFFDRFAGVFHAFASLERSVDEALANEKPREAVYRLFSKQYDSVRAILERVTSESEAMEPVERYVILMTAKQTLDALERAHPELFAAHREDAKVLSQLVDGRAAYRLQLLGEDASMPQFLGWFDEQFLKRATPPEAAQ